MYDLARFMQGMQACVTNPQVIAASGCFEAVDDVVILADQAERAGIAAIPISDDLRDRSMIEIIAGAAPIGDHGKDPVDSEAVCRPVAPSKTVGGRRQALAGD